MMPLKSIWKTLVSNDQSKPPARNEKSMVADSLMSELDYNIKELEKVRMDKEQEETLKKRQGVDYSWLITTPQKGLQFPITTFRTGALFRDSLLNEPQSCELPSILRACVKQILQQRPKEQSLTEWVTQRTMSLTSLKGRHSAQVVPSGDARDPEDVQDIQLSEEVQNNGIIQVVPMFTSDEESLPV
ncbi:unnamed protein product [Mytilus coruscus]|uniref:RD3 n=1 Tax=Mytilus coruscus TaxID=42192 RepID=A0A6J8CGG6_MYTCO|nr:unnamed protein product [Mytilus coruscus]